jgi:beta-lactamase superfamily II metal-dependent hydrolase
MSVASHPHADHIVGLPAVLARVPVGLVLEPGCCWIQARTCMRTS